MSTIIARSAESVHCYFFLIIEVEVIIGQSLSEICVILLLRYDLKGYEPWTRAIILPDLT